MAIFCISPLRCNQLSDRELAGLQKESRVSMTVTIEVKIIIRREITETHWDLPHQAVFTVFCKVNRKCCLPYQKVTMDMAYVV